MTSTRVTLALLAAALLLASACGESTRVAAPLATEPASTSTGMATESTRPIRTTATPIPIASELATVADDGWYPWLFPPPVTDTYVNGCASPESVVESFMRSVVGIHPDSAWSLSEVGDFRDSSAQFAITNIDAPPGRRLVTQLHLERVDPDFAAMGLVECDAWGVLAASGVPDRIQLNTPNAVGPIMVGDTTAIAGAGWGDNERINVRLVDSTSVPFATGVAEAGWTITDWTTTITVERPPVDQNTIVVATSETRNDPYTPIPVQPFAAFKGRYAPGHAPAAYAPPGSTGLVAVIGPNAQGLEARTTPGATGDALGVLDPYAVGIARYGDTTWVDDEAWILIGTPESRDLDAWIPASAVTQIEGDDDVPDALWRSVASARAALDADIVHVALAKLLSDAGQAQIVVSGDGFFDDADQVLSIAELENPSPDALVWGYEDGTGDAIEATVTDWFATRTANVDRVSVNARIAPANSINNALEAFPGAVFVELHTLGRDNPDFDWSTTRLVFAPQATDGFALVAIAYDSWTI